MPARVNVKIVNLTGAPVKVRWPEPTSPDVEIKNDGRLDCDVLNYTYVSEEGAAFKFRKFDKLNIELEHKEDVFYIIPTWLTNHPDIKDRTDILIVKDLFRDDNGYIAGCRFLQLVNVPDWLPLKK